MTRKRDREFGGKISSSVTLFSDIEDTREPSSPDKVAISAIQLPVQQPRRYFDPQRMEQLVLSVKEHGILEPILVRTLAQVGTYELVAGERRYRAAKKVGLTEIPVVIREMSDEQAVQFALIENLQREDLNPMEETEGVLQLLSLKLQLPVEEVPKLLYRIQNEAKGKVTHNVMGSSDNEGKVTHNVMGSSENEVIQSVFSSLGTMTWESFVNNRLPLLGLPEDILAALRQGQLAYTKAQAIARLKDEGQRQALLQEAIAQNLSLAQIRGRIKEVQVGAIASMNLKDQVQSTHRRLQKARVWDNPKKRKQIESLLAQMEALLAD